MYVGVTLRIDHEQQRDLDLPASIPVFALVDRLVPFFIQDVPVSGLVKHILVHQEGNRIIKAGESLSQSGIADGDHLSLVERRIPSGFLTKDDYDRISGPALVSNSGSVAPLERKTVVLGSCGFNRPLSLRGCFIDAGNLDPAIADDVSNIHALIIRTGTTAWIQDLGTDTGFYLNGADLPGMQRIRLNHGDVLTLGECKLLFIWDYQGVDFECFTEGVLNHEAIPGSQ